MSDLIDRAEAISRAVELRMYGKPVKMVAVSELERLPKRGETTLPEQADSDRLGVKTGETCADTISRQAAIEKFEPWLKVDGYSEGELNMLKAVLYELRFLPSAQPEKRTEERTETHACDLQPTCNQLATDTISRQSAIEVIDAVFPVDPMKSEYAQGIACGAALAKTYVEQLPSVQPEIIRCKVCIYSGNPDENKWRLCHYDGGQWNEENHHCGYAERSEVTT